MHVEKKREKKERRETVCVNNFVTILSRHLCLDISGQDHNKTQIDPDIK